MTRYSICCDFDGTICLPDACDFLLSRFAGEEWKRLDEAVWRKEITEREAFPRQMALINVPWDTAKAALIEGVRLREGFAEFVEYCGRNALPLTILSSGLTELIEALLEAHGIRGVRVEAHRVEIEPDGWHVLLRGGRRLEEHCSHCKCAFLDDEHAAGRKVVYVGDSFTDLCPAHRADVVFATYKLARELSASGRPYHYYDTFFDVEQRLNDILHSAQDL